MQAVPRVEVERTYLELKDRSRFQPAFCPDPRARVERVADCPPSFFRYLYVEVGRGLHWVDRLGWSDAQIRSRVGDPCVFLHLLTVAGAPAGYFELERHEDGGVEIAYFGLLRDYHGRGLGKYLLTAAVEAAWALGAARVWLHTCSLDGPAALPNYLARGFERVRADRYEVSLPG